MSITEIAVSIGAKLNLSPLEILRSDIDEFILLLNYFLQNKPKESHGTSTKKEQRVKVNDKTASGGWF